MAKHNNSDYDYSKLENQSIQDVTIEGEVKTAFIDYAMSVIVSRALPDVRDGLKPGQRRILYAMYEDRLTHDKPFRKSATTVGNVLGRYHPHGDGAVYDTMVRMAQPFSLRYPLVQGHGNFGNIDGDGAAAYRYTEARMAKIADEMLADIEKDVVDWDSNFDNTRKEPSVLPSRFPNLLVNGSIGIAVGMATNIPTHNMGEVCDAAIHVMDNPDCAVQELLTFVKGPDFPTYGTIYGTAGIYEAYMTGRGRLKVRAKAHFEENKGRTSIIITELPYQVNRTLLLENMVNLVRTKKIEGISDIRNESGRRGMRIVVDVKKDANAQIVLNLLYKYTQLQDTCAINMLALVDGEPRVLNLKQILEYYIKHQEDVTVRKTQYELARAEREAHIYEGYKKALDNIEEVIKIIRSSKTIAESKENLIARFEFSDIQAQAIVDLPLGRLSGMETQKILDRLETLYALIRELKEILGSRERVLAIIKDDLIRIKEKYSDERRTSIVEVENEILIEDLINKENCVVTVSHAGYIKRMPSAVYQAQHRGGKGVSAMTTREEDFVQEVISAFSHDYMLLFSNKGRVYIKKCYEIPESSRTAKGMNVVNLLSLDEGEKITACITVSEFSEDVNLVMITKNAVIKRVSLIQYRTRRTNGLYAVTLDEGDELLGVMKTDGNCDIIAASHNGYSIRFSEQDVRLVGRQARGVRAMSLRDGDYLVGCAVIPADYEEKGLAVLTITENGFGKRSDIESFTLQNRGGKGLFCHRLGEKTGPLAGIAVVEDSDDIMMITESGMIIRINVFEIPVYGRTAGGVIVMRTAGENSIVSFACVKAEDEMVETMETVQNDMYASEGIEDTEAQDMEGES